MSQSGWNRGEVIGLFGVFVAVAGFATPEIRCFFRLQSESCPSTFITGRHEPTLTPKQTIEQYYDLAPSNPNAAKAMLSNYFKSQFRSGSGSRFWHAVSKVDIYAVRTEQTSANNTDLQVWLKYFKRNGTTSCESRRIQLILDKNQGKWLINKADDAAQKPDCEL